MNNNTSMFVLLALWFCAAAAAASSSSSKGGPQISWHQTEHKITIDIHTVCVQNTKIVNITHTSFSLRCTANQQQQQQQEQEQQQQQQQQVDVSFEFREDVNPSQSECVAASNGEEHCTVVKAYPHFFDRLTRDPKALAGQLSSDWTKYDTRAENHLESLEEYDDELPQWTLADYKKQTAENELVVVDIDYPWCTQCIHSKKSFIALAKALKKSAKFGFVDAREEYELRDMMKPTCSSHICFAVVTKQGELPRKISITHDLKENRRSVEAYLGPLITTLTTPADVKSIKKNNAVVVVGYKLNDEQLAQFAEIGPLLRGTARLGATSSASIFGKSLAGRLTDEPALIAFRKDGKGSLPEIIPFPTTAPPPLADEMKDANAIPMPFTFPPLTEHLRKIVLSLSLPLITTYDYNMRSSIEKIGIPIGRVFVNLPPSSLDSNATDISPSPFHIYEQVATQFRGRVCFVHMSPTENKQFLVDLGLSTTELPAFGLTTTINWDGPKYAYEGSTHDTFSLTQFIEDALAGRVPAAIKSDPLPPPLVVGTLGKLSAKNVYDYVNNTQHELLIVLYRSWSSEWPVKNSTVAAVARCLASANVFVAVLDTNNNYVNPTEFPEPTTMDHGLDVYFYGIGAAAGAAGAAGADGNNNRQRYKYSGSWTRKDLLRFAKTHSAAVDAHWGAVAAVSEEITQEIKAEEEARRLKMQELDREREAALASGTIVALTPDLGVRKKTFVNGTGDFPLTGARISAHYVGTLDDGSEFDSSRKRGKPFEFTLGQNEVIKCWDTAFAQMNVGEQAIVYCAPDYGYGVQGMPPSIPSNSNLNFEVELVSFTQPKDEL